MKHVKHLKLSVDLEWSLTAKNAKNAKKVMNNWQKGRQGCHLVTAEAVGNGLSVECRVSSVATGWIGPIRLIEWSGQGGRSGLRVRGRWGNGDFYEIRTTREEANVSRY